MANSDKKVLVVEDDKDYLEILKQGLTGNGFSVIFAQDGEEGLKMIEKEKPDLVISDILMPKMDGLTMIKKLKEKGIKPQIIFLSNLRGEMPVAEGIIEEKDYIIKANIHINDLVLRIKEKLQIK